MSAKITTGLNDRPRDTPIAGTAPGLPDDSGRPVDVDEADAERMEQALRPDARQTPKRQHRRHAGLPQKGSA